MTGSHVLPGRCDRMCNVLVHCSCCCPCDRPLPAVCVNAGMIVTLVLSSKLWEHRKALRAEAAATQAAKDK